MSAGNTATPPTEMQRLNVSASASEIIAGPPRPARCRRGRAASRPSPKPAPQQAADHVAAWPIPTSSATNRAGDAAAAATSRRITVSPSAPAYSATGGSWRAISGAQRRAVLDVGRVRHDRVDRARAVEQVGLEERDVEPEPRGVRPRDRERVRRSCRSATTSRSGRSSASASATAPLPGPDVDDARAARQVERASTSVSVSGRGISTRPIDVQVDVAEPLRRR